MGIGSKPKREPLAIATSLASAVAARVDRNVPVPIAAAPEPTASTPRKPRRLMAEATTRSKSCTSGRGVAQLVEGIEGEARAVRPFRSFLGGRCHAILGWMRLRSTPETAGATCRPDETRRRTGRPLEVAAPPPVSARLARPPRARPEPLSRPRVSRPNHAALALRFAAATPDGRCRAPAPLATANSSRRERRRDRALPSSRRCSCGEGRASSPPSACLASLDRMRVGRRSRRAVRRRIGRWKTKTR